MKILFINVVNENKNAELSCSAGMGTLYLASYLSKYGGYDDVKVVQCGKIDALTLVLAKFKPDIVGVSSVTQNFNLAQDICRQVKLTLPGVPVIVGGVHISTLPQSLTPDMDIGVIGEGEQTMLELVQGYESNGLADAAKGRISGIVFRDLGNSKIITTPRRDMILPLDRIPFPARHLVAIHPYEGQGHTLITSRGCPFSCIFCSPSAMWHTIRYHSPEYVVSEMRQIYDDYRPKYIGINDDLFAVNKKRLIQINNLMKQEEFYRRVRFSCQGRANLMDNETARLLKEMNVTLVCMGLESGNQRTLGYLKCNSVTVEQNKSAIDALADNGIEPVASFIIGSPNETREEMLQTLDFIKESRLSYFQIGQLLPYPGTKVWEECKAKGLVSDDMDWSTLSYVFGGACRPNVSMSVLPTGELVKILSLFLRERSRRLRRRNVSIGLKHPERLFERIGRKIEFLQNKYGKYGRPQTQNEGP